MRLAVRARGCLRRPEFLRICEWKTPRSKPRCAGNDEFTIRTVTRAAFATRDEALKMDFTREFWLEYLTYTRALAKRLSVDIRTLDRALWQYSKVRQPRGGT